MSIQKLFAILVALSVLLAPGVTSAAMAAPHHSMQMVGPGHCQAPTRSDDHDKMGGKTCCISMCTAIAVAAFAPVETAEMRQQAAQFVPPKAYHGLLAEIATPPPRQS